MGAKKNKKAPSLLDDGSSVVPYVPYQDGIDGPLAMLRSTR
ncbi:MAG: hypothetical protein KatS3mg111_0097 [Pirellulaceae bacterium]|nr:MAG: hypothetical protein KatS3mg111_0097 [Pirellulaceae bacterium]